MSATQAEADRIAAMLVLAVAELVALATAAQVGVLVEDVR